MKRMKVRPILALTLAFAIAACESREEVSEAPVTAQPDDGRGALSAPYEIRPLDGRVTVDTQRFEMPVVAEDTFAGVGEND